MLMPGTDENRKPLPEDLDALFRRINPFPVVRGEYFRAGEAAAISLAQGISNTELTDALMSSAEYGRLLLAAVHDEPLFNEMDSTDADVFDHQVGGYGYTGGSEAGYLMRSPSDTGSFLARGAGGRAGVVSAGGALEGGTGGGAVGAGDTGVGAGARLAVGWIRRATMTATSTTNTISAKAQGRPTSGDRKARMPVIAPTTIRVSITTLRTNRERLRSGIPGPIISE